MLVLLVLQAPEAAASQLLTAATQLSVGLGRCSAVGSEISLAHPTELLYHIINVFEHFAEQY